MNCYVLEIRLWCVSPDLSSWMNIFKQNRVSWCIVKVRQNGNATWVWPNMINMKVMDCDQKNEWDGLW